MFSLVHFFNFKVLSEHYVEINYAISNNNNKKK